MEKCRFCGADFKPRKERDFKPEAALFGNIRSHLCIKCENLLRRFARDEVLKAMKELCSFQLKE